MHGGEERDGCSGGGGGGGDGGEGGGEMGGRINGNSRRFLWCMLLI